MFVGADLTDAYLLDANLAGANLIGTRLVGANLTNATLSGANLTGADLKDATLAGANLTGAKFRSANLTRANLYRSDCTSAFLLNANLTDAQFEGAILIDADFTSADLSGANLADADLTEAYFAGANLSRANLTRANFTGATLNATILVFTDLSSTIGLNTCRHTGPTAMDHWTLSVSRHLPLEFLRGCGLPERVIEYLPSFYEDSPIRFYSCFISYSSIDQTFADRLHADLQNRGIRCWFAPHDMQPGKKIHEQIDEAIRVYDRLLLILSDTSMKSSWVKHEIEKARAREIIQKRRVLFPVTLVPLSRVKLWEHFDADLGQDLAKEIRQYFLPDFSGWKDQDVYRSVFERIVTGLEDK